MAARHALQKHPVLLELQHAVVAVQAAESLADPIQHPFAKPFSLWRFGAREDFVWCPNQTGESSLTIVFLLLAELLRHQPRSRWPTLAAVK